MVENKLICGKCGGRCCTEYPGEYFPEQLGETEDEIFDTIKKMLKTGYFCIRPTFSEEIIHVLSPITLNSEGLWDIQKGDCIFLGKKGCILPKTQRPQNCNDLIPHPNFTDCYFKDGCLSGERAAEKWYPYSRKLFRLVYNINRGIEDGF
jgi:Fe-S-cluster containining protein